MLRLINLSADILLWTRSLNGAKSRDFPVAQPTQFELVISLRNAKALGLKIPQSILVRANRVFGK